jgi:pimeloyl-ACP methyl ester carboxylesterase
MKHVIITVLLCVVLAKSALASPLPASRKFSTAPALRDRVILIHGLGRSPLSMVWLKWSLQRAGYEVTSLRYPSLRADALRTASERLDRILDERVQANPGKIHFVTHSLGGIVLRDYLASHTITNLGRVVMLAPPNHGSELADHLKKRWLGRFLIGPVACELGTTASDLPARLGPAHFPLGIIAADGPGIPWNCFVCKGPSDGIVSVESAKLEGMSDFMVVHGSHTLLMCRSDVCRQVRCFLENGQFARPKKGAFI